MNWRALCERSELVRPPQAGLRPLQGGQTEEPKLDFVEPKLTQQGVLKDITAGFFGSFSPR